MWGSSPEWSWPSSSSECSFSSSWASFGAARRRLLVGVGFLVGVALLVVIAVELEEFDVVGELEDGRSGRLDLLDDVDHALFESGAVGDEQVGVLHRLGLLRRRCEVMRVGADGHDHLDLGQVADRLGHDVAEDVRGDHDPRQLAIGRPVRCRLPLAATSVSPRTTASSVSDPVSSEPQATAKIPREQTAAIRIGVRIFLIALS